MLTDATDRAGRCSSAPSPQEESSTISYNAKKCKPRRTADQRLAEKRCASARGRPILLAREPRSFATRPVVVESIWPMPGELRSKTRIEQPVSERDRRQRPRPRTVLLLLEHGGGGAGPVESVSAQPGERASQPNAAPPAPIISRRSRQSVIIKDEVRRARWTLFYGPARPRDRHVVVSRGRAAWHRGRARRARQMDGGFGVLRVSPAPIYRPRAATICLPVTPRKAAGQIITAGPRCPGAAERRRISRAFNSIGRKVPLSRPGSPSKPETCRSQQLPRSRGTSPRTSPARPGRAHDWTPLRHRARSRPGCRRSPHPDDQTNGRSPRGEACRSRVFSSRSAGALVGLSQASVGAARTPVCRRLNDHSRRFRPSLYSFRNRRRRAHPILGTE